MNVVLQINQNVFDGWTDYKINFLFTSWSTAYVWQFVLTCLAIFTASLTCHLIRWGREFIKKELYKINMDRLNEKEETMRLMKNLALPVKDNSGCLTFSYFVISLLYYTLCLFVLLGSMTFNPWIFISTVLGYSIGDTVVFKKVMELKISRKY